MIVLNVEETGLFWKKNIKKNITRLIILLDRNAAGCCKLKPLLIYQSENPKALTKWLKKKLWVEIWKSKFPVI